MPIKLCKKLTHILEATAHHEALLIKGYFHTNPHLRQQENADVSPSVFEKENA